LKVFILKKKKMGKKRKRTVVMESSPQSQLVEKAPVKWNFLRETTFHLPTLLEPLCPGIFATIALANAK